MLEPLPDLPSGVLGFEARGRIEAADYEQVLVPAVDRVLADDGQIRIVLVFPTFEGLTPGAAWQDLKVGVEHLTRWRRIALVTDVDWMIDLTHLFGWMTPGELRHFPLADRAAAISWAAAD